ncbi:hypothetical protein CRG98_024920 [Punica granatum]|uniref:valine--tRNA ligase n=1 Tax=Punica granatum TaxID=22663 RepID=A0A2I0JFQ2_PUNGR|nr:hypothetical protein CRG98_024920 [Punica granatum]
MTSDYPSPVECWTNERVEQEMDLVQSVVKGLRSLSKLGGDYIPPEILAPETMPFSYKWMLSVLNKAIAKAVASLNTYEFSDATRAVYSWWQQLCDDFIKAIKPYFVDEETFVSERSAAQYVLWVCLENGLRLLHPFMPFITEEPWQRLPSPEGVERKKSIMISDYPSTVEVTFGLTKTLAIKRSSYSCYNNSLQVQIEVCWTNEMVEQEMDLVQSVVQGLRSLRSVVLTKQKNEWQ